MMFHDYLARFSSRDFRRGLIDLFSVLDTPIENRNPYLDDELLAFPYVNGGMFAENNLEIPNFTDELRELILEHASSSFDWSEISPTIFGAVFESTLNPETRRSGGMHYTSIENIHKVIDPLFLDELKNELNEIRQFKQYKTVEQKAKQFQSKLSNLVFFDPACGSGNFLTETYISIRRLENEAIKLYMGDTVALDLGQDLVKVNLNQFYGIEINDFAVSVAKTALWIAESQMLEETKDIVFANIDFLPLKSYTNIVEGNALRLNWEEIIPKDKLSYIIGNPPFVGANGVSKAQKQELLDLFGEKSNAGILDYVGGWYAKSALLINNTNIRCAFVSTNSISQGEQVSVLWDFLLAKNISIDFAYKSFVWNSEAKEKAKVHCIIIGFSSVKQNDLILFDKDNKEIVKEISPYLTEGKMSYVRRRNKPISQKLEMSRGNQPTDGGHLIIEAEELDSFIKAEPKAKKYIKKLIGSREFINNLERYCLWLVGVSPKELRSMPKVLERINLVKEMRLNSSALGTRKLADRSHEFRETKNPSTYLIIPRVSSETRRYIPIGFLDSDTIPTDSVTIIENATLYEFGILTSNVHMAWMRTVAGRLKSDYRYSAKIVYNNFPWPEPTEAQKETISKTAQAILKARALYPDSSLADLYDELTMPVELRQAHQENDKAVMRAYGLIKVVDNKETWLTERETVTKLFEMYEELTKKYN